MSSGVGRSQYHPEMGLRCALTRLVSRPLVAVDRLLVAAMFVLSLLLYAATAARTVTGEDAGEFLTAAHVLGVPHPPGYPLWLLLGWAADHLLPFGTVAFRVTTASFVFSALANALFLAVALKTIRSRLAACAGAALFAVSLTHWSQAVIPEVYGLNSFFFALSTLQLVLFAERPTVARLLAMAFVAGLACTNHTTAVPVALLLLAGAILIAPPLFKRPGLVALVLLAGVLPNALYLILLPVSSRNPYLDWGNPETLSALYDHVTRTEFARQEAARRASEHVADFFVRLGNLREWGLRQFGSGWMLLLCALGFLPLARRQTGLWLFLSSSAGLCTIGLTHYMAYELSREHLYGVAVYWIPAAMTLAWYAACGLDLLVAAVDRRLVRTSSGNRRLATAVGAFSLAALVALPGAVNFRLADRSRTTLIEDYGRALLDGMEPDALYFSSNDRNTLSVIYQQGVLGYRADVTIAGKYGPIEEEFFEPVFDDADRARFDELPLPARPEFIESVLMRKWRGPVYCAAWRSLTDWPGRTLEPVGLLFRVMTADEARAWWAEGENGAEPPGLAIWNRLAPLIEVPERQRVDLTVQSMRNDLLYMRGYAQLRAGHLDDALATWGGIGGSLAPLKQTLNNCGSALAEAGQTAEALTFFDRALEEDPRYANALRNKAFVHRARKEWSQAIEALQAVVAIDLDDKAAGFELARLLEQDGRVTEALAEYGELAKRDETDPWPWVEKARLLERVGQRDQAEQAYARAQQLERRRAGTVQQP